MGQDPVLTHLGDGVAVVTQLRCALYDVVATSGPTALRGALVVFDGIPIVTLFFTGLVAIVTAVAQKAWPNGAIGQAARTGGLVVLAVLGARPEVLALFACGDDAVSAARVHAIRIASVTVDGVAIVTLLVLAHDAIATGALRAVVVTPVAIRSIPVVTDLHLGVEKTVTAACRRAVVETVIGLVGIAVVAGFLFGEQEAITAGGVATIIGTRVVVDLVAVVALLGRRGDAVTATGAPTRVPAEVVVNEVAIVTLLVPSDHAITTVPANGSFLGPDTAATRHTNDVAGGGRGITRHLETRRAGVGVPQNGAEEDTVGLGLPEEDGAERRRRNARIDGSRVAFAQDEQSMLRGGCGRGCVSVSITVSRCHVGGGIEDHVAVCTFTGSRRQQADLLEHDGRNRLPAQLDQDPLRRDIGGVTHENIEARLHDGPHGLGAHRQFGIDIDGLQRDLGHCARVMGNDKSPNVAYRVPHPPTHRNGNAALGRHGADLTRPVFGVLKIELGGVVVFDDLGRVDQQRTVPIVADHQSDGPNVSPLLGCREHQG